MLSEILPLGKTRPFFYSISYTWILGGLQFVLLLHTGTSHYLSVQICTGMILFSHVLLALSSALGIQEFFVLSYFSPTGKKPWLLPPSPCPSTAVAMVCVLSKEWFSFVRRHWFDCITVSNEKRKCQWRDRILENVYVIHFVERFVISWKSVE